MSSERTLSRLHDIVENAEAVSAYVDGLDLPRFRLDRKTQDAVECCLARITEAVIQLGTEETARAIPNVSFAEIKGLGNRLRHEYGRIDPSIIFAIARDDLPPLREAALRALSAG